MIPDELGRDNGCDDGAGNSEQHGVSLCCALNYGMRPEPRMNDVLRIHSSNGFLNGLHALVCARRHGRFD
jgi:hypothetical protein